MDFRHKTPSRRVNPPTKSDYKKYRKELREDFNERCGYCGDHDFFRQTYYEIDHFVPQDKLKTISPNEYSNLVYSCRSCNNSKRAKWPTNDEHVHNDGRIGFIDPCDPKYAEQFQRGVDGSIIPCSEIGEWMWHALNFGNPAHRIIWNLEEIRDTLMQVQNESVPDDLTSDIKLLIGQYIFYENALRGVPHF